MDIADSWAQLISAAGGLAGFTALAIELLRRRRKRKVPPEGLLAGLMWLNEQFGDILAKGGERSSSWFLERERRTEEDRLAIANGQIVDDKLNEYVGDARRRYHDAWTFAHDVPRHIEMQINTVEKGRSACVRAIDRANELLRKYGNS